MHKSSVYNDKFPWWIPPCKHYPDQETENNVGRTTEEEAKEGRSF